MHRNILATAALAVPLGLAAPAVAGPAYIALGDSITFGETDLRYVPSLGDRGYPARYADFLAGRDGETADSFMDGTGRTPPVVGRTDVPLALQNLNYDEGDLMPQSDLFRSTPRPSGRRGTRSTP